MKHHTILILALALLAAASCGTSAKSNLSDGTVTRTETVTGIPYTFYIDNHSLSRKGADKVFDTWAKEKSLKGHITGKRLMSIAPKSDGCHLTYDFRMVNGTQQRVVLIVEEYTKTYRKKAKRTGQAVVNGRQYNFRK